MTSVPAEAAGNLRNAAAELYTDRGDRDLKSIQCSILTVESINK